MDNWNDAADQQALGRPPRRSGRLIGLFLMLAVMVGVAYILKSHTPPLDPGAAPAVGHPFEKLRVEPITDNAKPLTLEDLKGQVVLINFWGPWCGPCVHEFPELVELSESLSKNPQFRFISISSPQSPQDSQNIDRTKAFLKARGYELPVHHDPQFVSAKNLAQLSQDPNFAFPTTVLLDRQGIIRSQWVGYRSGLVKEMREKALELLKAE